MAKKRQSRPANRLKLLRGQKQRLTNRVATLSMDPNRNQKHYVDACQQLQAVNTRLQRLTGNSDVIMTEHAQLRYLQRVLGVDLDKVCKNVLTPQLKKLIELGGNGKYPIGDGYRALVIDKTIVTVLKK